jgi:hypothetical protein
MVGLIVAEGVFLDEFAAWLDHVAHQPGEDFVGDVGLRDFDPQQRAIGRVERGFPQLLGIHFAKAFVALDAETAAARCEHGIEQFRRAGDRDRLAGVGDFLAILGLDLGTRLDRPQQSGGRVGRLLLRG